MLDLAIFAVTFVIGLLVALLYIWPSSRKRPSTVPGLDPSDEKDGNFPDIARAGSLHEFLLDLHAKFGEVAAFWWGGTYVVSVASAALMKEEGHVFDRPAELFKLFEPLITPHSIQYANGQDGRRRRHLYDKSFTHDAMRHYYVAFKEVADEMCAKWTTLAGSDQHIPLGQYMMALALRGVTQALFSGQVFRDDKEVLRFKRNYEFCWEEMESRLRGSAPQEGDGRQEKFEEARAALYGATHQAIIEREKSGPSSDGTFLDLLVESDLSERVKEADALTFVVGGTHTTGYLMMWCLYYLARDKRVQTKVVEEIERELKGNDISPASIGDLKYLRQVIDETMRCSVLAPWAARYRDTDCQLAGHVIPKQTPVLHALGVMLQDPVVFPDPTRFDPSRFDPDKVKGRHGCAFLPFGGPGKRICPGYRFAYVEATIFLSTILRKFEVHLAAGQEDAVTPVFGLVTHPQFEVWVTISTREQQGESAGHDL